MRRRLINSVLLTILFWFSFVYPQEKLLDGFDNIKGWNIHKSDGVSLSISQSRGYRGNGLVMDFKFSSGGYCGANKIFDLELPDNYEFSFMLKSSSPKNNLEFKLIDESGDNVWWLNQRDYEFSKEWKKVTIKKRNISFAWGPLGGGDIKKVHKIEIIVAAGSGGKGRVIIDDLKMEPIESSLTNQIPMVTASSSYLNQLPSFALDGDTSSVWTSNSKNKKEMLQIDFNTRKEYGGLVIDWQTKPGKLFLETSNDKKNWNKIYEIKNIPSNKSYILLPNNSSRFLKINFQKQEDKQISIKEIRIKDAAFGDNPINLFELIAAESPRGCYPKHLSREMSYWTILGSETDEKEALVDESGMIEIDKSGFTIEPFLYSNNRLITWNDVSINQSLEKNYLPIPIVKRKDNELEMEIKTFAYGKNNESAIYARYTIKNISSETRTGTFYLAFRPFQVNPIWQFLNITGGLSKINSIQTIENGVIINNEKSIYSLTKPNQVYSASFDEGNIIDFIASNTLTGKNNLIDHSGYASGAMRYDFNLSPGEEKNYYFVIPFYKKPDNLKLMPECEANEYFTTILNTSISDWEVKLNKVKIKIPDSDVKIVNTLKSYLAYILINRDNNAIQPGSRSYERAWIRDGSLTGGALLHFGITEEVKKYIDWYSKFIYDNGKVPCVVDKRGADPVPENDSHGEYIYAVLNYYHFTKDMEFLRSHFSMVKKVVGYIDTLTSQRKTDKYKSDEYKAYFGLMPESISHEGYSAKPMHSYWDGFFTMKGLKDAVTIAQILGEKEMEIEFAKLRDEFKTNLYKSLNLAMKNSKIDYIPGCVELGDFDATSTAIALYPCNELLNLPKPEIYNTFDKYFDYFTKRKNSLITWDAYTPYEVRLIGALTLLGQKKRAHELLDYFMSDQRPKGWNHWAEVVWNDPKTPKFIGDMPHTWVGSDYINSIRNMFVFEDELNESLVIGLGIKEEWLSDEGITIENMPTQYGNINIKMKREENKVITEISGDINIPKGKIVLKNILDQNIKSCLLNGKDVSMKNGNDVVIDALPAKIENIY